MLLSHLRPRHSGLVRLLGPPWQGGPRSRTRPECLGRRCDNTTKLFPSPPFSLFPVIRMVYFHLCYKGVKFTVSVVGKGKDGNTQTFGNLNSQELKCPVQCTFSSLLFTAEIGLANLPSMTYQLTMNMSPI